jgi:hypothetical protein
MEGLVINGVEVTPEGGLVIAYGRFPRDVRKNGLMWSHQVHVPAASDYDDEIEAVTEALQALLVDVLEDEDTAEPVDLTEPEEEEDDEDE